MNISPAIAKAGKLLTGLVWLVILANFIYPFLPADFSKILNTGALIVAALHMIEVLIFKDKINQQENASLARLKVLIFGVFEVKTWS